MDHSKETIFKVLLKGKAIQILKIVLCFVHNSGGERERERERERESVRLFVSVMFVKLLLIHKHVFKIELK